MAVRAAETTTQTKDDRDQQVSKKHTQNQENLSKVALILLQETSEIVSIKTDAGRSTRTNRGRLRQDHV